jgi:cobalt-zinc-cadmium efflux system protein
MTTPPSPPHDHHGHEGHDHPRGHAHDHGHAHAHGHGHGHAPARFDRAFALGIALNTAFVAVEAGVGWHVDSLALLADAGHNLSDVAGLVLAWAGAYAGRLRPDWRHSWGWQRATILAAFANALLLLVAMGMLGWEAIERLKSPQPVPGLLLMGVAGVGIVVNGLTAWLFMRGSEHDLNLRGAFLHMLADALVSAGVVVVGALALFTAWTWLDPVMSLVIVAVIVVGTWSLFRQSLHLLFDGVPAHVDLRAVHALLAARPGVAAVDDLHVWATGTTRTVLTAHLRMQAMPADDAFLDETGDLLRERFGIAHVTLQLQRGASEHGCAARPPAP